MKRFLNWGNYWDQKSNFISSFSDSNFRIFSKFTWTWTCPFLRKLSGPHGHHFPSVHKEWNHSHPDEEKIVAGTSHTCPRCPDRPDKRLKKLTLGWSKPPVVKSEFLMSLYLSKRLQSRPLSTSEARRSDESFILIYLNKKFTIKIK